jgi:hypothetical protein
MMLTEEATNTTTRVIRDRVATARSPRTRQVDEAHYSAKPIRLIWSRQGGGLRLSLSERLPARGCNDITASSMSRCREDSAPAWRAAATQHCGLYAKHCGLYAKHCGLYAKHCGLDANAAVMDELREPRSQTSVVAVLSGASHLGYRPQRTCVRYGTWAMHSGLLAWRDVNDPAIVASKEVRLSSWSRTSRTSHLRRLK